MEIKVSTIASAHERIVKSIIEQGRFRKTEDNELTYELKTPSTIIIESPLSQPRTSQYSSLSEKFMKEYSRQLMEGSDNKFDYTYHERLFKYGDICSNCDGIEPGLAENNQINFIINKLKSTPESRRAIAIIGNPFTDQDMKSMPCLQLMQCHISDNKLHMNVVFRSNDMLSAFGHNAYALTDLQQHIANELKIPIGTYVHISLNPHVYYKRDQYELEKFAKGLGFTIP